MTFLHNNTCITCFLFTSKVTPFTVLLLACPQFPVLELQSRICTQKLIFIAELYDESCLLENPYFQVSNMDCWPCENIKFVLNLTDSKQNTPHVGLPYIIKVHFKDTASKYVLILRFEAD